MNKSRRNPILWLSILLNLVLTIAIIFMCSSNDKTVGTLEQKVSEYETALSSVVESYESKLYAATTTTTETTTTTSELEIEKTTTTAYTTSAQITTTAAQKTTAKTTTAKKTTTTKATTTTQKPTTAATQSGDNDGGWIDGWY